MMKSNRHILAVALCVAVAFCSGTVDGKVFSPPDFARMICLQPGAGEGTVLDMKRCNIANNNEDKTAGVRLDGKCAFCGGTGDYDSIDGYSCHATTRAVTYVQDNIRRCACNVGFYGNSTVSGCKPCPTGTTTKGYGAASVKECSICAVGYTGKVSTKCTACSKLYNSPAVTTAAAGGNQACVCPLGFTGAPGKCKKCTGFEVTTAYPGAQTCLCPAGGKPPFCKPCKDGVVLAGRCECPAGATGVWPNCHYCPDSLSYEQTTLHAGRNQQCVCNLRLTMEGFPWSVFLTKDSKTGACKCNNDKAFYYKVVPNNRHSGEWSLGPCDAAGFQELNTSIYKVVTLNGVKRLGCDTSKGYGASIASQVFPEGGSGPYCFKCGSTDNGSYIDAKTTRCECKAGYGVNPAFAHRSENKPPFDKGYCIKCDGPMLKLGTIPETKGNDTFCRCNWEGGWAGRPDDGACMQCPSGWIVNTTTGNCECPKGYYTFKAGDYADWECAPDPTCAKGEYASDGVCYCPLIREADSCVFPAKFCDKVNITFWTGVKAANADFNFTDFFSGKVPTSFLQKTWSKVNTSSNLLDLAGLTSKKNVAVLVEGYICTRTSTVTEVEMTSVGSTELLLARMGDYVEEYETVINQVALHSSSKTSYYGVDSGSLERSIKFRLQFYSGATSGVLKLKTVGFPYVSWSW